MDHLVVPLDPGHVHVIDELIRGVAAAAGLAPALEASSPHLTLIAHSGLDRVARRPPSGRSPPALRRSPSTRTGMASSPDPNRRT